MKRLDHILFQADTDFIAFYEAQQLSATEFGVEVCECFARFIANQAEAKKAISSGLDQVEVVLAEGGGYAAQLRAEFFPQLNAVLKCEDLRAQVAGQFGRRSKAEWSRLQHRERYQVI